MIATDWSYLFFINRLWHQLTLKLTDFVKDPYFKTGDGLIQVTTPCTYYSLLVPFSMSEDIITFKNTKAAMCVSKNVLPRL